MGTSETLTDGINKPLNKMLIIIVENSLKR